MLTRDKSRWLAALSMAVALLLAAVPVASATTNTTISVLNPSEVLAQSATLRAQVNLGQGRPSGYCKFFVQQVGGSGRSFTTSLQPCPNPPSGTSYTDAGETYDPGSTYSVTAHYCTFKSTNPGAVYDCAPIGESVDAPRPVTFTTPEPVMTVSSARLASQSSATITGSINGWGLHPEHPYVLQYSTDPNFAFSQSVTLGNQPDAHTYASAIQTYQQTTTISGLQPATRYYVRYEVDYMHTNASMLSTYTSASRYFDTGATARTDAASSVGATTAVLNGAVNPGGAQTSYHFVYGPTADFNAGRTASTAEVSAGAGVDTKVVSAAVSGLRAGTAYLFRIVATSGGRTVSGQAVSFTTAAQSCPSGYAVATSSALTGTRFRVSGCFKATNGRFTAPYVGLGRVTVNGIGFSPTSPSGTLTIDPSAHTISSSGTEDITGGTTVFSHGVHRLHFDAGDGTFTLASLASSSRLNGFPLGGKLRATPVSTGARLTVTAIGLPNQFGDVTAPATVNIDATGKVTSGDVKLGGATIGPFTLPSLRFTWKSSNTWTATADLTIPKIGKGPNASLTVEDGKVTGFHASYQGFPIPIAETGVTLDTLGLNADWAPPGFAFGGNIGFGVEPSFPGGIDLLSLEATGEVEVNREAVVPEGLGDVGLDEGTHLGVLPVAFTFEAEGKLFGVIPIGETSLHYWQTPWPIAAMSAEVGIDAHSGCWGLGVGARLAAAFHKTAFNVVADAHLDIDGGFGHGCITILKAEGQVLISSKGAGACGGIGMLGHEAVVGLGGNWPRKGVHSTSEWLKGMDFFWTGCNLSRYVAHIATAQSAAAGRATLRLTKGDLSTAGKRTEDVIIKVRGRGGAPRAALTTPDGRTVPAAFNRVIKDRRHGLLVIPDPRHGHDVTYYEVVKPVPGAYRIRSPHRKGEPRIVGVSYSTVLPKPAIRVSLRRASRAHGRPCARPIPLSFTAKRHAASSARRAVTWHARRIPGREYVFREVGASGDRVIYRTPRGCGRFSFNPAPAAAGGERRVVVDVLQRGVLQAKLKRSRYRVPATPAPRRPSHVRLHVRKGKLSVTWHKAKGARRYRIKVAIGDGRRLLRTTKRTHITVSHVARGSRVAVDVRGISVVAKLGAPAKAHTRGAKGLLSRLSPDASPAV